MPAAKVRLWGVECGVNVTVLILCLALCEVPLLRFNLHNHTQERYSIPVLQMRTPRLSNLTKST